MLRSRNKQQGAAPPNSNGSIISSSYSSYSTRQQRNGDYGNDNDDDDPRGTRSKSIVPKSLIGTLIVASVLFLMLLLSGSLSNNSSSSSNSSSNNSNSFKAEDSNATNYQNNQLRTTSAIQQTTNNNDNDNKSSKTTSSTTNTTSTTSPTTGATLHLIFSTDCSTFQHWQSYLFFHRAYTIQQPGYITRIASGCTDQQMRYEQLWHQERIQGQMSHRYRIHFTPHFSGVKDDVTGKVMGDYKFFNKPFGLKHFLEKDELLGLVVVDDSTTTNNNTNGEMMKHPNDIIILCDPDFALLRPITDDFSNERDTLIGPRRTKYYQQMSSHIVTHGQPFAQTYGLGTQWRKFNLDNIAGVDSPAKQVDQKNGGMFYPAGPPYIGTARDMYKIAVKWSEFAPRVHKEYPHLLAEMYAYCIAAAHLQLPHTLLDSLMISVAGAGGEGWKFISAIPPSETCSIATTSSNTNDYHTSIRPLPSLIHYCQRYVVDNQYFWGKRKIPHDIFTCNHPLLTEPPMNLGQSSSSSQQQHTEKDRMNAFMICTLTKFTNDAMLFFKERHCEDGGNRERKDLVPMVDLARRRGGG